MAKPRTSTPDPGEPVERKPTVKLTTTITQHADERIRRAIFEARGNNQAWWEALGEWLLEHPDVIDEVTRRMTAELGGRRRR